MAPRVLLLTTKPQEHEVTGAEIDWVAPLIVTPRFAEVKRALGGLPGWGTLAFTSAHAVDAFIGALRALGQDARALSGRRLVAVGGATAARLSTYALSADLVADGGGATLARELLAAGDRFPDPVVHLAAAAARPELAEALRAAGRRVETLAAYDSAPDEAAIAAALRVHAARPYQAVGFFSPRGVAACVDVFGATRLRALRLGAVGETTRAALAALGFDEVVVAGERSTEALLHALLDALAPRSTGA